MLSHLQSRVVRVGHSLCTMTTVIAIDVALLLPADVAETAVALNRALPPDEGQGLVLDAAHLPHVTPAQLFVATERLTTAIDRIGAIARNQASRPLRGRGGSRGARPVWQRSERDPPGDP